MKSIILAGVALSLMGGVAVQAQGYQNDRRDRGGVQEQRRDVRDDRRDVREDRRDLRQDRQELRQDQRQFRKATKRFKAGRYTAPRGYRAHAWREGERLPNGYYGGRYVISDYNRYGLYDPPRGYQWQRVGNDAVLVALASGVIGAAISQLFY